MSGFVLNHTCMHIVSVKGVHVDLTDAIQSHIESRVRALETLTTGFEPAVEVAVECRRTTAHHHKGDVYQCSMTLQVPGTVLRAEQEADDLYAAIDIVKDDLMRQIKDYKERQRDLQHQPRPDKA